MPYLIDLFYLFTLIVLSPWLIYKALTTGKYRRGLWAKLLGPSARPSSRPVCWFHGVSVGEIHLLRPVVAAFRRRHPDWDCVISATTDTGLAEAHKHFADLQAIPWPFDFSWAVRRALRHVRPSLVVLAESELWPNFLLAARKMRVPVAVINARMSPRSFRNYARLGPLARWLLAKVDLFAVQTEDYAANLRRLGVPVERVRVTGSVKYDGVTADRGNPRTEELRRLLAVSSDDLVWIAGSTQAPEEEMALNVFRRLRSDFPRLRLFLVPRQKDRFDEVARLLERSGLCFVRRSSLDPRSSILDPRSSILLVDTIGELGALWGLADVAFVGGSLDGKRGGQNMIEPAAYGAAVLFGPHVWNFADAAVRLQQAGAAVQVADEAELEAAVRRLLTDVGERRRMGAVAREFVRQQQGATERTLAVLDELVEHAGRRRQAA